MATLIIKVNTYSPATSVVDNTQVIRISVGNIILPTTGDGGSGIVEAVDITDYVAALEGAMA